MGLDEAVGLDETIGVGTDGMDMGKVALVHDDLVQAGGAERVVVALHDIFPQAPVYTSLYVPKATFDAFRDMDVRTSYLQKTPFASRRLHKLALPLFPSAFEGFDLSGFDLVLSNTTRFAKGVITPPETCHVCYCHTPPRFAWRPQDYLAQDATARTLAPLMRGMMKDLRIWDLAASQRVDYFVAGSQNAARRIRKYYRRDSAAVIYPARRDSPIRPRRPRPGRPALPGRFAPGRLQTNRPGNQGLQSDWGGTADRGNRS